jgi:hypothetical protein
MNPRTRLFAWTIATTVAAGAGAALQPTAVVRACEAEVCDSSGIFDESGDSCESHSSMSANCDDDQGCEAEPCVADG